MHILSPENIDHNDMTDNRLSFQLWLASLSLHAILLSRNKTRGLIMAELIIRALAEQMVKKMGTSPCDTKQYSKVPKSWL